MRKAYISALIALFLFSIGFCSLHHKKPSQPKQQLPEWIIPLYKVQRGDSSIWCALPEYVFEKNEANVMNFMCKFPDSLERFKEYTIKFHSIGCRDKQAAKDIAKQGFLLFNPQYAK